MNEEELKKAKAMELEEETARPKMDAPEGNVDDESSQNGIADGTQGEEQPQEEEANNIPEEKDDQAQIPGYVNPAVADANEQVESGVEEPQTEDPGMEQNLPGEKMLTQSQVNELVGKARQEGRESALKELYGRYGVSGENEMNDMFGMGQAYQSLNDDYTGLNSTYKQVMAENALLKSQIDQARWDDVKLILGGKGLEVSPENIATELATHPEWKGIQNVPTPEIMQGSTVGNIPMGQENPMAPKVSTLRKLGEDISPEPPADSEEDEAMKLFNLKR